MKKIINILFLFLFIFTSCEEDLDINTNPNTPQSINKGLALSAAQGSIATIIGGELFNLGGMYAQFYTQAPSAGQYDAIDEYNLNTDFANRLWTELYAGALNDLQFVQDRSFEDGDTGTYLIATSLKAYTFQYLVDIFGDVPYTEALQGNDNIAPMPTAGQEIYVDLLASIDEALTMFENNPVDSGEGQQDLIYNADMDRWVEFANTLKLKIYLRMAYTSQANATAVMELINEDNFLTSNAAIDVFTDATSKRNPFYEVQVEFLGNVNGVASNSLLEFYNRNDDPRLMEVYTPNSDGQFVGIEQGIGILPEPFAGFLATQFSRPDIEPETPVYFMSVPESYFLQAEAVLRYAGGNGAEELYNNGIMASFDLYEAGSASIFIDDGGVYEYEGGDTEEALEQIIVQKWASLANVNNIEAWIETKRTGFPIITDAEDPQYEDGRRIVSLASLLPGDQIPFSLFYPDVEVDRNTNITQKAGLTEKVWWNQR